MSKEQKLRDALNVLIEAADESDGMVYGTLSTRFVRDIAKQALATEPAAWEHFGIPGQAAQEIMSTEQTNSEFGKYEHSCPQVTGHRGPSFVCQKAGHGVDQNSYCKNCTFPEAQPKQASTPQLTCKKIAPLVRLTDDEKSKAMKALGRMNFTDWSKFWDFSDVIMDAMIKKNGGKA